MKTKFMLITEQKEYKDISKIIDKWLKIRKKDNFWHEPSDEDKTIPRYVMRMIREINDYMPVPCMDTIKRHESYAMGHVDYFKKFALYCTREYNELKKT